MPTFTEIVTANQKNIKQQLQDHFAGKVYTGASLPIAWSKMEADSVVVLENILVGLFGDTVRFVRSPNKNTYPDLEVIHDQKRYGIDIKSVFYDTANNRKSENDLGTINSFAKKKAAFVDQFFVFIRYQQSPTDPQGYVVDFVFFNHYWEAIGKRRDGSAEYREKDGNLRPKSWTMFLSNTSNYASEADFLVALDKAVSIRAYNIIGKQMQFLSDGDLHRLVTDVPALLEQRRLGLTRQKKVPDPDSED